MSQVLLHSWAHTALASIKDRESTKGIAWGLIVVIEADVETPFISNRKWQDRTDSINCR